MAAIDGGLTATCSECVGAAKPSASPKSLATPPLPAAVTAVALAGSNSSSAAAGALGTAGNSDPALEGARLIPHEHVQKPFALYWR